MNKLTRPPWQTRDDAWKRRKLPIWGFLGPEGGGKSACMTYMALAHACPEAFAGNSPESFWTVDKCPKPGAVRTFEGYDLFNPRTGEIMSRPVSVDEWATNPAGLKDSVVCIDELQNWLDAMRHNSVMAKLFGYFGIQRRKFQVGVFYTVQNWAWAYDRVRYLTHLLTYCRDIGYTDWGQAENVEPGTLIRLETWDVKGFFGSGEEWGFLGVKTLDIRSIYGFYESYTPHSLLTAWTKVVVDRPTIKIRPPGYEPPETEKGSDGGGMISDETADRMTQKLIDAIPGKNWGIAEIQQAQKGLRALQRGESL